MYIQWNSKKGKKNNFPKALLMESYRDENGVPRKRTIANLAHCSAETIKAIELALKYSKDLTLLGSVEDISISQGISFGAQFVMFEIIQRLGISKALGNSHQAKLAIWQIIARILEQGSRLSAIRLARDTASDEILSFEKTFCEDDLYRNLLWLAENQESIENKLFKHRCNVSSNLFLYDVTSTYLEGQCNELADYGYNRDKKRGKQQIVIGLLTDAYGFPLSIQAFDGNTNDTKTLKSQIEKISGRFGCKEVTFVGDKGMIKSAGISELTDEGFHYITTITKPQIEKLIEKDIIQLSLFDNELMEVEEGATRYIFRRNPIRAMEIEATRKSKEGKLLELIEVENKKKKAKLEDKIKRVQSKMQSLYIREWTEIKTEGNEIKAEFNQEKRKEETKLDGCYVIKTDLKDISKETIHRRYKDLALVENAFRSMKTVELELRPVYVITKESTRGHLLVVMLAYMVIKELQRRWKEIDLTVKEGIERLKEYTTVEIEAAGGRVHRVPKPTGKIKQLLEALEIVPPMILPPKKVNVLTRKKLRLKP